MTCISSATDFEFESFKRFLYQFQQRKNEHRTIFGDKNKVNLFNERVERTIVSAMKSIFFVNLMILDIPQSRHTPEHNVCYQLTPSPLNYLHFLVRTAMQPL